MITGSVVLMNQHGREVEANVFWFFFCTTNFSLRVVLSAPIQAASGSVLGGVNSTHAYSLRKSRRHAIHRLESANSVFNCAVFMASPR